MNPTRLRCRCRNCVGFVCFFQTIGVLSDGNGINGSEEDFIKRKGACVSEKDLSLLVKKYSQKNSTEKPPVQSLPGAAF